MKSENYILDMFAEKDLLRYLNKRYSPKRRIKSADYKSREYWNKSKLWKLRQEIVLNSLFTVHYENTYQIPAIDCENFFQGFIKYCFSLEKEKDGDLKIFDIMEKYNNKKTLWDYFRSIEHPFSFELPDFWRLKEGAQ